MRKGGQEEATKRNVWEGFGGFRGVADIALGVSGRALKNDLVPAP